MTIGKRLKIERERLGKSEVELGRWCGHVQKTVMAWEEDHGYPCILTLGLLADNGLDIHYILTGKVGVNTEKESGLLSDYRKCPEDIKNEINETAKKAAQVEDDNQITLKLY